MKEMRDKKATGYDDAPGDVLQLLGDSGLTIVTQLINNIYKSAEWSKDFGAVTMIAIKKKPRTTKCSDHCTISLNAHAATTVERILRRMIERKYLEKVSLDLEEEEEPGMQFGC